LETKPEEEAKLEQDGNSNPDNSKEPVSLDKPQLEEPVLEEDSFI